jgi:hypothetical protein
MKKTIELKCECPKSEITSMTEAFFGLTPGTLSKMPQEKEEDEDYEGDGDRTAADYADDEPIETE